MAGNCLTLGPVVFREFELPECVTFGGRQRISLHHLGDGDRVVSVLGSEDADIRFSGIFSGSNATTRAIILDELRCSGRVMELIWGEFAYSVIIRSFRAEYRNATWIPYEIVCIVDRNAINGLADASLTLIESALADLRSASDYSSPYGYDLTTPMVAVAGLNAGPVSYNERRGVADVVNRSIAGLTRAIQTYDDYPPLTTSRPTAPHTRATLASAIGSSHSQWASVTARGYVQRASIGLSSGMT